MHLIELEILMMSVGKELFRNGQNTETFSFFENPYGIDSIRAHLNCGDGWCAWFVGRYEGFFSPLHKDTGKLSVPFISKEVPGVG